VLFCSCQSLIETKSEHRAREEERNKVYQKCLDRGGVVKQKATSNVLPNNEVEVNFETIDST
jgi:hypothetical protein